EILGRGRGQRGLVDHGAREALVGAAGAASLELVEVVDFGVFAHARSRLINHEPIVAASRRRVGLGSCSASPARAPTPSLCSGPSVRLAGCCFTPSSRTRIVLGFACARSDTLALLGPFGPTRRLLLH